MPVSTFIHRRKRCGAGTFLEQLDLQHVVDDEIEAVPGRFQQMLGGEHTFQQHDRLHDAGGAQREPLFQPRDTKRVRIRECQSRRDETVPISVRLHDRHHAGAACPFTNHP